MLSLSYGTDEDIEFQVIWVICPSTTTIEKSRGSGEDDLFSELGARG